MPAVKRDHVIFPFGKIKTGGQRAGDIQRLSRRVHNAGVAHDDVDVRKHHIAQNDGQSREGVFERHFERLVAVGQSGKTVRFFAALFDRVALIHKIQKAAAVFKLHADCRLAEIAAAIGRIFGGNDIQRVTAVGRPVIVRGEAGCARLPKLRQIGVFHLFAVIVAEKIAVVENAERHGGVGGLQREQLFFRIVCNGQAKHSFFSAMPTLVQYTE